uniref:Uncharacterized protein n=1 Tax=Anopheles braziliensis TaxID=58242 RepID=A0A2M3ZM07_9DIPT
MMLLLLLHYCYCFSLLSHTRNPGFYGLVDRTTIQRPRELTARTALALRGYTFNSSQPLSLSFSQTHTNTHSHKHRGRIREGWRCCFFQPETPNTERVIITGRGEAMLHWFELAPRVHGVCRRR